MIFCSDPRPSASMTALSVPSPWRIMESGSFSDRERHLTGSCSTIRTRMPTFSTAQVR